MANRNRRVAVVLLASVLGLTSTVVPASASPIGGAHLGEGVVLGLTDSGVVRNVTSPVTGTWGSVSWTLGTNGTLTIGPGTGADNVSTKSPWHEYRADITRIKFSDPARTVLPSISAFLLADLNSLTSIEGIGGVDTSRVTTMSGMFMRVSQLESLDLSGWNTSNVTDMSNSFNFMRALVALDVSG